MDATLQKYIDKLNALNFKEMYEGDFFLTWDKSCLLYTSCPERWIFSRETPTPLWTPKWTH